MSERSDVGTNDMTHPLPYASWESRGWWEGAGRGVVRRNFSALRALDPR